MPCVLVETSFISNRREEKRLVSSSFQDDLARAMARGIHEYLNEHPELAAAWGE
jgi:N-acetylmuramoyl-L-alanine amidase